MALYIAIILKIIQNCEDAGAKLTERETVFPNMIKEKWF